MASPVDLTNLREITDGDIEMEQELFKEFISTCDAYVEELGSMLSEDKNEAWRITAHALKGISLNLGAVHLGELSKKAQENNTSNSQEKTLMLEEIKQEYILVKNFLNSISV